ncbi:MAG: chemotaxis protein [Lachnospiraceae bacterium]
MANFQTIATRKYQNKVGIISKSYKLKRDLCDDFAEACKKAGVSQSGQVTKMMREFIDMQNMGGTI